MTTPTDMPIEDRLRAHFADRARTTEIPGPENDTALARAREGRPVGSDDELGRRRARRLGRRGPLLAVAAAAVVIALVAGVVLAGRDDRRGVTTITEPTPAPTAPSTTMPPPSTTVSEPPPTTSTPAPPPAPGAATGPIVGADGIFGSWDGSAWVPWRAGDPAPADQDYQLVELGSAARTVRGTAGVDCSPAGAPSVDVGLATGGRQGVAVAGGHDLLPRAVEIVDPGAQAYRDAAGGVARTLGVADDALAVRQVVRGDLDGDGTVEALVVAGRGSTEAGQAVEGDWSVVFELRVVGGEAQPTVIDSDRFDPSAAAVPPAIEQYRVDAVADVNGDGRMEVVVSTAFWENSETGLLAQQPDGALAEVLSVGCGV